MNDPSSNQKTNFTTKDTKSTKFKTQIFEPFVAFVHFVVRKYFVISSASSTDQHYMNGGFVSGACE
jgi:hypothetical protein